MAKKLALKQVVFILGSMSDLENWKQSGVWGKITEALQGLGVSWTLSVISADRNPEALKQYVIARVRNGARVFIAAAGKAAVLPSAIKAWIRPYRPVPVLGVALSSQPFGIEDALLSIVSKPAGTPIATFTDPLNAVLFAAEILSATSDSVAAALLRYHQNQNKREEIDFLSDEQGEDHGTPAAGGR